MNLLGWHWLIKLHRFQVYSSIMDHLYIVLCAHHPKSSVLPPPFIPPHPLLPPLSLPSGHHHSVGCIYELIIFLCLIPSPFLPGPQSPHAHSWQKSTWDLGKEAKSLCIVYLSLLLENVLTIFHCKQLLPIQLKRKVNQIKAANNSFQGNMSNLGN